MGGIRDNQITAFTLEWMKGKNVNLEIIYFDSFEEQKKAFQEGEIDLLAQTINNVLCLDGISIAAKIGEEPFYLAISKNRSDLLTEMNDDGSVNWLPTCAEVDGIIINKTLFDEYNVPIPTDYESFIAACEAFEGAGIRSFVSDFSADYTCMEVLQGSVFPRMLCR